VLPRQYDIIDTVDPATNCTQLRAVRIGSSHSIPFIFYQSFTPVKIPLDLTGKSFDFQVRSPVSNSGLLLYASQESGGARLVVTAEAGMVMLYLPKASTLAVGNPVLAYYSLAEITGGERYPWVEGKIEFVQGVSQG
jgi:hypothetical protein